MAFGKNEQKSTYWVTLSLTSHCASQSLTSLTLIYSKVYSSWNYFEIRNLEITFRSETRTPTKNYFICYLCDSFDTVHRIRSKNVNKILLFFARHTQMHVDSACSQTIKSTFTAQFILSDKVTAHKLNIVTKWNFR